jgi:hypothetical protein
MRTSLPVSRQFHEQGMGQICRNTAAAIGLMLFSQLASAAPDGRVAQTIRLAQAAAPAAPVAPPPADSKAPEAAPAATSPPPNPTSTVEVTKPAPSTPGCALRYMAAELAGKLKGRKWKEFHAQECAASEVQAVFPTAIAPKYSGEPPDKARTLTCADQFKANKPTNGNGGLKWIEKSGGYYSECVIRLKG